MSPTRPANLVRRSPDERTHAHRRWRQEAFGWNAAQAYSNTEALYTEIEFGKRIFRKGGFSVINVTNKPIEETADQVIAMISRYFEHMVTH